MGRACRKREEERFKSSNRVTRLWMMTFCVHPALKRTQHARKFMKISSLIKLAKLFFLLLLLFFQNTGIFV